MIVYYDTTSSNQVMAIYSEGTSSTVWTTAGYTQASVNDPTLIQAVKDNGRDCTVTVVDSVVTVVTPFDNPMDHTLAILKQQRYVEIDTRTRELIDAGFVHDSKTFSLSDQAQSKWHGKYNARADVTFPFNVSAVNNESYSVADGPTAKTMYLLVVNTVSGHLESGGALKDSIFAAVDKAAVDAITDTR